MCLAVPGKILKIEDGIGTVEVGNVKASEGEYVLVHVGCAI